MTESEKESEDLEAMQQQIAAISEEKQECQPPTQLENVQLEEVPLEDIPLKDVALANVKMEVIKQQVAIILTHSDDSDITKDGSISPKPLVCHSVGVQTQTDPDPLFNVIPDDGTMGYDDGVRVLRAIGTWAPEYSGAAQYVDNLSLGFVTADKSATVSSFLNGKTLVASSTSSSSNNLSTTKTNSDNKSFQCTVCHKYLARKDKLVIHMRIHTGEKPYVCEVCDRPFSRRDKLVMHMNKFRHRTPANVAPLGKRPSSSSSLISLTPIKKVDLKPEKPPLPPVPQSETLVQELESESLANELEALGQPRHVVAWSCEICGRLCNSRDEWAMHAKSHLDEGDVYLLDSHGCMLCGQEFSSKSDLTLHLREHLPGKGEPLPDLADIDSTCSDL